MRGTCVATLASSEEEHFEGGSSPPPRKKARKTVNLESEMHRRRTQFVGDVDVEECDSSSNGELLTVSKHKKPSNQVKQKAFTTFEVDSVRLIGQHLRGLGLQYVFRFKYTHTYMAQIRYLKF